MKILVIGGTGMLGSSIMLSEVKHSLWGTYLGKKPKSKNMIELDITDKNWVKKVLLEIKPDAIIHTAAITDVDLCELKPQLAEEIHVEGTKNLLEFSKELNAYFLYISTDSVFNGAKGNYTELDIPDPLNVYAKTKYKGELLTLSYKNSSVTRTNIFGYNWLEKLSLAEWILQKLRNEEVTPLFKDVYFSPLLVNNLAQVLIEFVENKFTGLYHVACPEGITKLDFGYIIAEQFSLKKNLINPISIFDLDLKAKRPLNPILNCLKVQQVISTKLLNVLEGIKLFKKLGEDDYLKKLNNL